MPGWSLTWSRGQKKKTGWETSNETQSKHSTNIRFIINYYKPTDKTPTPHWLTPNLDTHWPHNNLKVIQHWVYTDTKRLTYLKNSFLQKPSTASTVILPNTMLFFLFFQRTTIPDWKVPSRHPCCASIFAPCLSFIPAMLWSPIPCMPSTLPACQLQSHPQQKALYQLKQLLVTLYWVLERERKPKFSNFKWPENSLKKFKLSKTT